MQDSNKTQISSVHNQTPSAESASQDDGSIAIPVASMDQVPAIQPIQPHTEINPHSKINRPIQETTGVRLHTESQTSANHNTNAETIKPVIPMTEQQSPPLPASETIKKASQPPQHPIAPPEQKVTERKPLLTTQSPEIPSVDDSPLSKLELDRGEHISPELVDYVEDTIEHNINDPKRLVYAHHGLTKYYLRKMGFDKING